MKTLWRAIDRVLSACLIGAVRVYQVTLSPFVGRFCRFTPTCSVYMIGAIRKHGAARGAIKGVWRICRCQPFCRGGFDPP